MVNLVIQKSFAAGEWAPELNARVDLAKYHSAAALLKNFYVDYRGGASSRPGTKYVLQALKSATAVRLIPFQASFTVNYVLEFGDFYIRFFTNGAPILETATVITGVTNASPGVVHDVAHGYTTGDWVFLSGIGGTTQLNNNYYSIVVTDADHYTLVDLFGVAVNTTSFGAYTTGGAAQRIYTIASPFAAADLALVKYTQSVNSMILCHPSYAPQVLTLTTATNWSITAINFNPTITSPAAPSVASTLAAGTVNYAYVVTAVDVSGQESTMSSIASIGGLQDLRVTGGTNTISWTASSGAVSYNIYKAQVSFAGALPSGTQFGFIGNSAGTDFVDSNISPDFTQCPPLARNPFAGAPVLTLALTANADYTTVPGVAIDPPVTGIQATGYISLGARTITPSGGVAGQVVHTGSPNGQTIVFTNGVVGAIATSTNVAGTLWQVNTMTVASQGSVTGVGNAVPGNPITSTGMSGGMGGTGAFTATVVWHVGALILVQGGTGYTITPAVTISSGAATATASLGSATSGNPSVPSFFDQRLFLAAPAHALQTFYMSQPGAPYNFNVSDPIQASDAITASIVSGKLNAIKSAISAPTGLIIFTSQQAWLVNGGANGASVTPIDITATGHAYNGASDVLPLQINFDYLYVQAKGSIVRDLTYNFYTAIYTGTNISVLSSHLFFGYQITEWTYAEEPASIVWAVRNDGALLSLTYVKEQEMIGWAQHDTAGLFKSVTSIPETAQTGPNSTVSAIVDAVYFVVERTVNGQTLKFIERLADRYPQDGYASCWAVDSGLRYSGSPTSTFTGLQHLTGAGIVGLADGVPFTASVSATGGFTLSSPASLVTAGLQYTPSLQTLAIDVGDPTIQGKLKNIPANVLRVRSTLGLSIGKNFTTQVLMKDLTLGATNSMASGLPASAQVVNDLWTGDARTILDAAWSTAGQYCISQFQPYYATVLGTIPTLTVEGR